MIALADILPPEHIFTAASWQSKKRVFEQVSIVFENTGGLARDKVFSALIERERLGSTYIGRGGAIPHGRLENLKKPLAALALLEKPIQYDGDESAVRTLFFLIAPPEEQEVHLILLGLFSEILTDQTLIDDLHKCPGSEEAAACLAKWENARNTPVVRSASGTR